MTKRLPAAPRAEISVREVSPECAVIVGTSWVDPDSPLLAGHYPRFPILPGLLLTDCVHALISATRFSAGRRLAVVNRARFTRPVLPDDVLTISATLTAETGALTDGDTLRCSATVSTQLGKAASIRLRYDRRSPGEETR